MRYETFSCHSSDMCEFFCMRLDELSHFLIPVKYCEGRYPRLSQIFTASGLLIHIVFRAVYHKPSVFSQIANFHEDMECPPTTFVAQPANCGSQRMEGISLCS